MIATILVCIFCVFALWLPAILLPKSAAVMPLLIAFAPIFGFASGSNISLTPVCVGQLCRTRDYGRYYATCYSVVSFGCLTGVPVAGALLGVGGGGGGKRSGVEGGVDVGGLGVVVFTGGCYLIGLGCFVAARIREVGWGLRRRY